MLGVNYKDQLALEIPKKEEFDYHGQKCETMEEKDCEKYDIEISLSRNEQDYYLEFEGHMQDPDYMKERLRKWVKEIVAYIHFLDADIA